MISAPLRSPRSRTASTAPSGRRSASSSCCPASGSALEELAARYRGEPDAGRHALRRLESEGLVVSVRPPRIPRGAALASRSSRRSRRSGSASRRSCARGAAPSAAPRTALAEMDGRRARAGTARSARGSRRVHRLVLVAARRVLRAAPSGRGSCARWRTNAAASSATSSTSAATPRRSPISAAARTRCSRPAAPGRRGGRGRDRDALLSGARRAPAHARQRRPLSSATRLMSFLLPCPNCGPRDVGRVHLHGRGDVRPKETPSLARADRVPLLPPERRRRPARVVVPPPRLRALVPGRARHPHERGAPLTELRGAGSIRDRPPS